jgi:hypothetical protein
MLLLRGDSGGPNSILTVIKLSAKERVRQARHLVSKEGQLDTNRAGSTRYIMPQTCQS